MGTSRPFTARCAVAAVAAAVAACGGGVVPIGSDLVDARTGPDAAPDKSVPPPAEAAPPPDGPVPPLDAIVLDGFPAPPPCPVVPPKVGAPCPTQGVECEYGPSLATSCNVLLQCGPKGWGDVSPLVPCQIGTCPPKYPATPPAAACPTSGLICGYPEGTCTCSPPIGPPTIDGGSSVQWNCFATMPGCPTPRPRIGSPCAAPSTLSCNYGACAGGEELACVKGVWVVQMVACPAL